MTDTPEYKGLYGEPLLDNATSLGAAEFERIVVAFRFNRLGLTSVDVAALIATVLEAWAERDTTQRKFRYLQTESAHEIAESSNSVEEHFRQARQAEAELAEVRKGRDWAYVLANDAAKLTLQAEDRAKTAREALRQILGWRERDRKDIADVIKFIEDTARAALNPEKSDG